RAESTPSGSTARSAWMTRSYVASLLNVPPLSPDRGAGGAIPPAPRSAGARHTHPQRYTVLSLLGRRQFAHRRQSRRGGGRRLGQRVEVVDGIEGGAHRDVRDAREEAVDDEGR